MLVCKVDFKPACSKLMPRDSLNDISLKSIMLNQDKQKKALWLSLIAAKKICKSLFGELEEDRSSDRCSFVAKFMADDWDGN